MRMKSIFLLFVCMVVSTGAIRNLNEGRSPPEQHNQEDIQYWGWRWRPWFLRPFYPLPPYTPQPVLSPPPPVHHSPPPPPPVHHSPPPPPPVHHSPPPPPPVHHSPPPPPPVHHSPPPPSPVHHSPPPPPPVHHSPPPPPPVHHSPPPPPPVHHSPPPKQFSPPPPVSAKPPPSSSPPQPPSGDFNDPAKCETALATIDNCVGDLITFFFGSSNSIGQACCNRIKQLSEPCFAQAFMDEPSYYNKVIRFCS